MSEEDNRKYEHMLQKRAEGEKRLRTSMISHLSTLNDGVIAIFITVMMLEIPFPTSERTYWDFVWSVLVFLVSFLLSRISGMTANRSSRQSKRLTIW